MRLVRAVALGVLLAAVPLAPVESDEQASTTGAVEVEIDSAMQAVRGQVTGQSGDLLQVRTATRQVLVRPPAGFSPPLGACIQVSGQVPLGPVFEAEQASLVPAEERASACP